jgi:transposase-like protein
MRCKRCGSENIVKSGIFKRKRGDVQKYRCKECKYQFLEENVNRRLKKEEIDLIIELYKEKMELRKIARSLGIALSTVQYHIKKTKNL